jgi:trehalose synthase
MDAVGRMCAENTATAPRNELQPMPAGKRCVDGHLEEAGMSTARTSDLWWKNAIVYCLDIETFVDSNGDGVGDVDGLTSRVDYLAGMGVTCLWLMPFHPSPNRDDGYDIIDYYDVDSSLGTLGDFVVLVRTAKDRGLRVIIDLVVNHTSDRHPWFRAARSSKTSPFRDFYVWREDEPEKPAEEPIFPDAEDNIWSYDDKTGEWYLHHFYSHQPDLNLRNPEVREAIARVAGFWLELGVDGFRVDAVPYMVSEKDDHGDGYHVDLDPHEFVRDLRAFLARRSGHVLLLGEVNLPPKPLRKWFGDHHGDQIQMLFNFPTMQSMYLAIARGDARPLARLLKQLPDIPSDATWATFVRNHDELTLDQLSDKEREEVFEAFGPDPDMQLFDRGLRRRLPPMLDGDQDRIRMVYSLLFSLPGTPVLFYGEEIGMGENLDIDGRLSVRTPMQWTSGRNGGFSEARPSRLCRPVTDGRFGPMAVNVADQRRDSGSLLNWMERVIRRRRETPAFGWGSYEVLDTDVQAVLAHRCDWEGDTVLAVHNLAAEPCEVTIDVGSVDTEGDADTDALDLLDDGGDVLAVESDELVLKLPAYGHRWYRLYERGKPTPP